MNLLEKEPHVQLEVRHDLLLDPPHSPSHGQPPHPAGGDVTLFLPPLHISHIWQIYEIFVKTQGLQ